MSKKTSLNMLRWLIINGVTLVIALIHMSLVPTRRAYSVPFCIVLGIGLVAWVVVWMILKKRGGDGS